MRGECFSHPASFFQERWRVRYEKILVSIAIALIVAFASYTLAQNKGVAQEKSMRYFLFTAKPSPEAWRFMKKNPGDRRAATENAMKKIGCEMLEYYWGLTNGRNYIIVAAPDGKTVQAMLVQRLSSGLVLEYEAIELVRSSDMPAMFQRLKEIEAADDSLK
jgi:uncharacterized protein with GYD domain